MKPDVRVARQLLRLNDGSFDALLQYLAGTRDEVLELLVHAPADRVPVLQGQARTLGDLLSQIEGASTLLAKFEAADRKGGAT